MRCKHLDVIIEKSPQISAEVYRATAPGGAPYEGDYEAIPDKMAQVFPTQNKTMRQDFTVAGVPTYRVSNPEGGTTLIIGGNKNGQ